MITNKNYNVDLAELSDKKLMFGFAKEIYFDEKVSGNKSTKDKSLTKLIQPLAVMAGSLENKIFRNQTKQKQDFYLLILIEIVIG